MRAKLPSKDGFVERDGVRIHYEVYGQGSPACWPRTIRNG